MRYVQQVWTKLPRLLEICNSESWGRCVLQKIPVLWSSYLLSVLLESEVSLRLCLLSFQSHSKHNLKDQLSLYPDKLVQTCPERPLHCLCHRLNDRALLNFPYKSLTTGWNFGPNLQTQISGNSKWCLLTFLRPTGWETALALLYLQPFVMKRPKCLWVFLGCLFLISCVFTYLGTWVEIAEPAWFYFKAFCICSSKCLL